MKEKKKVLTKKLKDSLKKSSRNILLPKDMRKDTKELIKIIEKEK
jgi:pantothenate synthetase